MHAPCCKRSCTTSSWPCSNASRNALLVLGVYTCSVPQEEPHNVRTAKVTCLLQCCAITSVYICAALQEELNSCCVAICRGKLQRKTVGRIRANTEVKEQLHGLHVPVLGRVHQGFAYNLAPIPWTLTQ